VALVPTMGALHAGHLALVARAREVADVVLVSIYVNPEQFAPGEDLATYPRDLEGDLAKLRGVAECVFAPASLYDAERAQRTFVEVGGPLTRGLCGASRPVFFRGVATVVTKLLVVCEPAVAVFGRKDFQQLRVVATLVRELDLPVRVEGVPLVREPDGLALSSRNLRLTPEHRRSAPALSRALFAARDTVHASAGHAAEAEALVAGVVAAVAAAGGDVDYVAVVDADTLEPLSGRLTRPALLAAAAHFGRVRLIDNVEITPPQEPADP